MIYAPTEVLRGGRRRTWDAQPSDYISAITAEPPDQGAQLEERLGLMLFERNQQRIRLTADGPDIRAETRSLLTHANRTSR